MAVFNCAAFQQNMLWYIVCKHERESYMGQSDQVKPMWEITHLASTAQRKTKIKQCKLHSHRVLCEKHKEPRRDPCTANMKDDYWWVVLTHIWTIPSF